MLGERPQYTTDNPDKAGDQFTEGVAKAEHSGFQQGQLPDSDAIWNQYYQKVLRGERDIDGSIVGASRTFTANNPPLITSKTIGPKEQGLLGKGAPDGGFVPTTASPGEGNGANPTNIPAMNGLLNHRLNILGAGSGRNGSCVNPEHASNRQLAQAANATSSPSYKMPGKDGSSLSGWSE